MIFFLMNLKFLHTLSIKEFHNFPDMLAFVTKSFYGISFNAFLRKYNIFFQYHRLK